MVYVSKNVEYVIETSVDGALLQAEQSVRPGKPEVSDVSKAPNSPSVSSPTVPSKTVFWFCSRTFYLAKIHC